MALNKDYLKGPTQRENAKEAIIQGSCIFGIGALATLGTWLFLGVIWFVTPIIAVGGAFRLLYGLISFCTGLE
jgi:hypothetical protein